MEYRNLGNSELNVSILSLGCLNFGMFCDQETTTEIINTAIDLGVNCIDTAALYGGPKGHCETLVGKAIEGQRDKVILATKFGADSNARGSGLKGGGKRDYIVTSVEESLTRLNIDYIDLYQMHFPDNETPIDETLRALDDLVTSGKVRYIGSSNFASWEISEAAWTSITNEVSNFVSLQTRYSILNRDMEKEIVPACEKHSISVLPFFPLESGLLTGKVKRDEDPPPGTRLAIWGGAFRSDWKFDLIDKIIEFGKSIDRNILEISLSWAANQKQIGSVLVGATKSEQLIQNIKAISWKMSPEEMDSINNILNEK
ncbi:MAG: aldo/keto reductase [Gammaproteobacteria bacterium]|nr:aldo/keto reductase [Gammaproteobacteria bacterium]|tara:strand:- start:36 stop:980 length:945 start_codon:yes stop_codon:yes gene_type:complete